jgi:uncharacterized membrane protein YsdA (DUF1294 family)/cold shock CspA family protein
MRQMIPGGDTMKGVVVKFDEDRGYGFIRSAGRDADVFVHVSEVPERKPLKVGQRVRFEARKTAKGWSATDVAPGRKQFSPGARYGALAGVGVLGAVIGFRRAEVPLLWSYLLAINAVTFLFYGLDKILAGTSLLRVPKLVLHGLALAGGTPGAFVGQRAFRHKTQKSSFRRRFVAVVILQAAAIAAAVYYLSPGS